MSEQGLSVLSKQALLGGDVTDKTQFYEACVKGKQCRVKFSTGQHTSKEILEYDEEVLKEILEEQARAEKELEEKIMKEHAEYELFTLEFGVQSDSEYESD
uniref:Retrovirus-related Pol polyprotein from transposon TNT 1-94 n=1 Tax=Tanacetum cinerariifolium TaxID=118510 RepID=A0A699RDN3_TANCI|nr:retrovirus-related Pol polyprotein from transposon TNT 1-94 [Tanacetum cinerariifolium]